MTEGNLNAFALLAYSLVLKDRVACVCRKSDLTAQKLNPRGVFFFPLKMLVFSTVVKSLPNTQNEAMQGKGNVPFSLLCTLLGTLWTVKPFCARTKKLLCIFHICCLVIIHSPSFMLQWALKHVKSCSKTCEKKEEEKKGVWFIYLKENCCCYLLRPK